MMLYLLLLTNVAFFAAAAPGSLEAMKKDVQKIVEARSKKWNCSFSIAIKTPAIPGPALTFVAGGEEKGVTAESNFAFGSITKMWTGASIMQLVAKNVLSLEQKAAPLADAQLAAMKKSGTKYPHFEFSKLSDLWGPEVEDVTIRNLLAMQSGIPDFDTATPSKYKKDTDPFRASVYAHPGYEFLEPELMSEPWVATHRLTSKPGHGFHYSSTNFGILGLILAHHAGVEDYLEFNQSSFLPSALADTAQTIKWANKGSPRDYEVVPGYDRTDYNGQNPDGPGVPVDQVHGVFSGWSASDFVGPAKAVAELGYALWGKGSTIVPAHVRDLMVPNGTSFMDKGAEFYGLASQNVGMMGITGGHTHTYGHLGATYGYDSIFGYTPAFDLAIAVATNIETSSQTQPSDAFCGIYNRVKNYLNDEPAQTCTFVTSGYYGGKCECK